MVDDTSKSTRANPRSVPITADDAARSRSSRSVPVDNLPLAQTISSPKPNSEPRTAPTVSEETYAVGYGKPPQRTQFKAGQSGNPKGRPKGSPNLASVFRAEGDAKVAVTENGRTRKISKREVVVKSIVNNAAKGNAKAMQAFLQLENRFNPPVPDSEASSTSRREELAAEDLAILAYLGLGSSDEKDRGKST